MSTPSRPPMFDRRRLQHSFGRAAAGYAEVAVLQRETESRLLEQLEVLETKIPSRVLDVGSGPGRASGVMKGRWPKSEVIALDIALPMLRQVPKHTRFWRPVRRVCAELLPGAVVRRRLLWRYTLIWRKPLAPTARLTR